MFMYYFQHFGVAVSAISGVLAARGKRIDLFGVIVLGGVTALGGGTIRDLVLARTPHDCPTCSFNVFWMQDANYITTAVVTAVLTFFIARYPVMPRRLFIFADALSLALFTIIGAEKALEYGASHVNTIVAGLLTGVAGGILRDVIVGEIPLVFRPGYLYATAAFAGTITFLVCEAMLPGSRPINGVVASLVILALRYAAIQWQWRLPVFRAGRELQQADPHQE